MPKHMQQHGIGQGIVLRNVLLDIVFSARGPLSGPLQCLHDGACIYHRVPAVPEQWLGIPTLLFL